MRHGDFTGLAEDYTKYRPDYSPTVLQAILGLLPKPISQIDAVDVGAGTGIWSRMLVSAGARTVRAVEPNDDMRHQGSTHAENGSIEWSKGSGEATGLPDSSADLLSMASSLHWVNFDAGIAEFCRVLRPGGCFVALWNPRFIEANPLLVEIEGHLKTLKGEGIERVSSGRSNFANTLTERLEATGAFADVLYLESKHALEFSPEQYVGAWRSVNDLRVQLGEEKFLQFLQWIEDKVAHLNGIEATYLTRAWAARMPMSA